MESEDCYVTIFERNFDISLDEQIEKVVKDYDNKGYRAFISFPKLFGINTGRIITCPKDKPIPDKIQRDKNKYVKFNRHWVLENELGVCNRCGEYGHLVALAKEGFICENCAYANFESKVQEEKDKRT